MTCRHTKFDPACSSYDANVRAVKADYERLFPPAPPASATPDAENYDIEDALEIGPHLVARVRYPSCAACSYEGVKVLVFLGVGLAQAIRWRRVDPHFREAAAGAAPRHAPSPAARFPASDEGWQDALEYARRKGRK